MFRHAYATMLYDAGVDIKSAQYLLGHASIEMTMEIYVRPDAEKNDVLTRRLNTSLVSIKAKTPD